MSQLYRIGLNINDIEEESLRRSGMKYTVVNPKEQILISAKNVVGKPYKRGASVLKDAPNYFDCSSLVAWVAVESGLSIPRISIDQYVFSKKISKEELQPGDLVFANTKETIHNEGTYYSQVLGKNIKEEAIRTVSVEYLPGAVIPEGVDHVGIYIGDNRVVHSSSKKKGVSVELLSQSESFKNIIGYGRIIPEEERRFVIEIPESREDLRYKIKLIEEIKGINSLIRG